MRNEVRNYFEAGESYGKGENYSPAPRGARRQRTHNRGGALGCREIFPIVSLIDGNFRAALEDEGNTFDREVAALKMARHFDLFTPAFVTDIDEAQLMLDAGADVICVQIYAGAVNSPVDMNYLYRNADCQGFIGGSTFDRIPMEKSILDAVKK